MTVLPKFIVPVKNANIVPSILGGVTLAKRDKSGRAYRIVDNVLNTISVNNSHAISGISISRFHLFANVKVRKLPNALIPIAQIIITLVSTFLKKAL